MVEDGVDIIDVGGESTRPDATPVTANEEIKRVIPFIKEAAGSMQVPISVDTYKIDVARCALDAGASIINDVSGLRIEPELVRMAATYRAAIVLTSNQRGQAVDNIVESVITNLKDEIELAISEGVDRGNIIVDPGIGFGKTVQQNLELVCRLDELKVLGQPILLGTSRKSFIGKVLDSPVAERFEGTAATVAIGISKGADIVRVHETRKMKLVCMMSDAVCRSNFVG
jgi:dihydropteroate synthase